MNEQICAKFQIPSIHHHVAGHLHNTCKEPLLDAEIHDHLKWNNLKQAEDVLICAVKWDFQFSVVELSQQNRILECSTGHADDSTVL